VTTGNPHVNDGLVKGLRDFDGVPMVKRLQIECARALTPILRRHL